MSRIPFYKFCGSGNDFIIIDNREDIFLDDFLPGFIQKICRRKVSVGADGLILVEPSDEADFKWRFYNSDGSRAEMCGNGARCVARFAYMMSIAAHHMTFKTDAGIIKAEVNNELVKIQMTDPLDYKPRVNVDLDGKTYSGAFINTGVPHFVIPWENPTDEDVFEKGRGIRNHPAFAPEGTNVNFVFDISEKGVSNRTYERGVEAETLACGTGCVACAIITSVNNDLGSPMTVKTQSGGYLRIHFNEEDGLFSDVFLEGDARVIYKGDLWEDSWKWKNHVF